MQGNVNIPDSTITTNLSFRQLVLMNMQQLTNFPYIEQDFDALTDYELLCLVVKFLNDVIANQNEQNDSITRMYESFLELQTYVNNTKDTLEDAFNNLDNYVRNYFDNLDVQEEINNKLDEMLEDGVLEQIIEQFIQSSAIWCFDTVADMKVATNLIAGSYARTLGYYSVNDGGGALYHIVNVISSSEHQETLNNGLYATLIGKEIDIRQLGAKGDNSTDDSSVLQEAINKYDHININDGTYIINDIIELRDNIIIKGNGTLKLKNNITLSSDLGNIFLLEDVSNVIIDGITFDGNKSNITSTSENYHKAILIVNGENITLNNCTFKNFYHQSVQVASVRTGPADENLPGISNLIMNNCSSNYTLCLLQITNSISNNINITNCKALNNGEHGIVFYKNIDNINIENCIIDTTGLGGGVSQTGHGIRLYKNKNVYINNSKILNALGRGITSVTEDTVENVNILNCIIDTVGTGSQGIYLKGSHSAIISCKIKNITEDGINIIGDKNQITRNEINTSKNGITLDNGSYNKLESNIISKCSNRGMNITNSNNTTIFDNTFIDITDFDCLLANTCTDSMISLNNGTIVNRGTIKQDDIQ